MIGLIELVDRVLRRSRGRYPCDHRSAQATSWNGPVWCHCGARWDNAEAYVLEVSG